VIFVCLHGGTHSRLLAAACVVQAAFVEEEVKQEVQSAVEATLAVRAGRSPFPPLRASRILAAAAQRSARRTPGRLTVVAYRRVRAQQATYEHEKVPQWTSDVIEGVMKKLTGLQKPFKYIGEWALGLARCSDQWPSAGAADCVSEGLQSNSWTYRPLSRLQ
jgi:hypothetical protein